MARVKLLADSRNFLAIIRQNSVVAGHQVGQTVESIHPASIKARKPEG